MKTEKIRGRLYDYSGIEKQKLKDKGRVMSRFIRKCNISGRTANVAFGPVAFGPLALSLNKVF